MRPSAAAPQQASLSTQLAVWFHRQPCITGGVLALCCACSLVTLIFDVSAYRVCLEPSLVVYGAQVWRVFTAPFFHSGLLHLLLNMSAWVPLGGSLERTVGSVQFGYLTLLFAALGGGLHALAGASAGRASSLVPGECAVGLSGVIFSLVVVDSHLSPAQSRSLFGLVSVPTRWYPLAMLLLLQLLLPSASLMGHLSGVLVGYAYVWGWLNWAVLPLGVVNTLERARCAAPLVARSNFILCAGLADPHGGGLPRWATAPGGADGGGVTWRTPAWLARAWAQAQAAADMSAPAGAAGQQSGGAGSARNDTFAGRGRALGGSPGARPPWAAGESGASGASSSARQPSPPSAPQPPPARPAAGVAAASARAEEAPPLQQAGSAEARARAARAAEARALGLSAPGGAAGTQPVAAGAVAAAAAGLLPTGAARAEATPPGLRQLVEMGYPEDASRHALTAAGGDISLALELLSTG